MSDDPGGLFSGCRTRGKVNHMLATVCSALQVKPVETFLLIACTQAAIETDKKYLFLSTWRILYSTGVSKGNTKSHSRRSSQRYPFFFWEQFELRQSSGFWSQPWATAQPTRSVSWPCHQRAVLPPRLSCTHHSALTPRTPAQLTMWPENEVT